MSMIHIKVFLICYIGSMVCFLCGYVAGRMRKRGGK